MLFVELNIEINLWMKFATKYSKIKILDFTPEIAILSSNLSNSFHSDPADRIIIATAIKNNIPLATNDERIISSNLLQIIK